MLLRLLLVLVAVAGLSLGGCKKEEPPQNALDQMKQDADKMADDAADMADDMAKQAGDMADEAAE